MCETETKDVLTVHKYLTTEVFSFFKKNPLKAFTDEQAKDIFENSSRYNRNLPDITTEQLFVISFSNDLFTCICKHNNNPTRAYDSSNSYERLLCEEAKVKNIKPETIVEVYDPSIHDVDVNDFSVYGIIKCGYTVKLSCCYVFNAYGNYFLLVEYLQITVNK